MSGIATSAGVVSNLIVGKLQQSVMQALYGHDVWDGFIPEPAAAEVQGWNGTHPSLSRLAQVAGGATVVDVGVWKGQSTITMAAEMKRHDIDGCVIAVDTFLGSPEHWDMAMFNRRFGMPDLYRTFMSNVVHAGVSDYVVPLPQTSVTAAAVLRMRSISAAVVHVDAAHAYEEALRDAEEYWELLLPGGSLIGDDYDVAWPGVVRAAGEFCARHSRPLQIEPPKWIVTKP